MFTTQGTAAKKRVCTITGEATTFDPFDDNSYGDWMPTGQRINFNKLIRNHVMANATRETGNTTDGLYWVLCAYCNWHYPDDRIQVDHVVNWKDYSMTMTTASNINNAKAWEIYIGCNDPNNLVASCDKCNASKNNATATPQWIQGRQKLAAQQGGF